MNKQTRNLSLNGKTFPYVGEPILARVAAAYGAPLERVALLINGNVVPRKSWHDTPVSDGDQIEILMMAAGG